MKPSSMAPSKDQVCWPVSIEARSSVIASAPSQLGGASTNSPTRCRAVSGTPASSSPVKIQPLASASARSAGNAALSDIAGCPSGSSPAPRTRVPVIPPPTRDGAASMYSSSRVSRRLLTNGSGQDISISPAAAKLCERGSATMLSLVMAIGLPPSLGVGGPVCPKKWSNIRPTGMTVPARSSPVMTNAGSCALRSMVGASSSLPIRMLPYTLPPTAGWLLPFKVTKVEHPSGAQVADLHERDRRVPEGVRRRVDGDGQRVQ